MKCHICGKTQLRSINGPHLKSRACRKFQTVPTTLADYYARYCTGGGYVFDGSHIYHLDDELADQPAAEIAQLKTAVRQLKAENAKLRSELRAARPETLFPDVHEDTIAQAELSDQERRVIDYLESVERVMFSTVSRVLSIPLADLHPLVNGLKHRGLVDERNGWIALSAATV